MKCPDLKKPMNGRVEIKKQTLDSTATYKCNEGFKLTGGDRVRKCLAGGSWSGKAPLCECKGRGDAVRRRLQNNGKTLIQQK